MIQFCLKSIITYPLLCGLSMVSCKDAGHAPVHQAPLVNPPHNIAPVADTIRQPPDNQPFLSDIDGSDLHHIDSLLSPAPPSDSFPERVNYFSRCFLGTPYSGEGPTGEGRHDTVDTAPIYNIHCFDCVTYVEHVFALALSGRDSRSFLPHLVRLRYKDGMVDYLHRNHYFYTDWLANNKDIVTLVGPKSGILITRTISKKTFFARNHLTVDIPDTTVSVNAWSVEEFLAALAQKSIEPGVYLLAFIKKRYRGVIVNHVGFVIIGSQTAYLLDANKTRGKVAQSDLNKYLIHNAPKLEGLLFARVTGGSYPD